MLTLIVFIVSFLLYLSQWVIANYGIDIALDQLLFHVQMGLMANEGADKSIIYSFIKNVVVYTVATTFAYLMFSIWLKRFKSQRIWLVLVASTVIGAVVALGITARNLHVVDYVQIRLGADAFSTLYNPPQGVDIMQPDQPRNLILLYVESLENKFKNIDEKNLIEPIDSLPGIHVPDFQQAHGTGWSIAGMVSSQCSIPLKGFEAVDWNLFLQDSFLPNAWCLSDVLNKLGYHQIFLTGPDIEFAGVNRFYQTHQFDELIGRDEARKRVPKKNLYSGWGKGLHDDTLLDLAYDVAVQAAKSPKPFNLTIITTDNHSPHGMASPRCSTKQKRSSFIGAVECTSKYVAQFVDRILKNKNLHNTDIVIMGDHLFMAIPEQISMFGDNRTIYFKYINSRKDQAKRDQMTHFDVAPSILDSLGLLKDNTQRFGLGYSVFAEIEGFPTHFEQALSLDILSPSIKYDELWRQDSNQNKDNVKK